jgi:hypothetical protein
MMVIVVNTAQLLNFVHFSKKEKFPSHLLKILSPPLMFPAQYFMGIYTRPTCAGPFSLPVMGTSLAEICFAPVSFRECVQMSFLDMLKVDNRAQIPLRTAKAQTRSKIAPIVASAPPIALSPKEVSVSPLSLPV